ncbi:MAG TPA: hypothetical protein VIE65_04240 [Methylobacter sp.]
MEDFFSIVSGSLVADCADILHAELVDSLRDEEGCFDVVDVDHYGDQLEQDLARQVDILAVYAEDALRFTPVAS